MPKIRQLQNYIQELITRRARIKELEKVHQEFRLNNSAYRAMALRFFKATDRGLDKRTFDEIFENEKQYFRMLEFLRKK